MQTLYTEEACTAAVRALVLSRLDYANSLLVGVLESSCMCRCQVAQNDAARIIARVSRRQHILPVLQNLYWLPIRQRISYKLLTLTYTALRSARARKYLVVCQREQTRVLRCPRRQLIVPQTAKFAGVSILYCCTTKYFTSSSETLGFIYSFQEIVEDIFISEAFLFFRLRF